MKTRIFAVTYCTVAGLALTLASARMMVLLAAEPACVQQDYRAQCPIPLDDPNIPEDIPILGPVHGDPNTWTVQAGKLNRVLIPCDPDGDPTTVTLIGTNQIGSGVVQDPNETTWKLVADLEPGIRWFVLRVTDIPRWATPKFRDVGFIIDVNEPANTRPSLN